MERFLHLLVFVTLIIMAESQVRPAYQGLLPAQVPHYELVGIDLYLDTLLTLAAWCIGFALAFPVFIKFLF